MKWAIGIIDKLRRRLSKPSGDPPLDVDLGLRPEGRSGAVVRTIASYERYYREWGEAWEMQALLRAAFVAGDRSVGDEFLAMVDKFRYPTDGVSENHPRDSPHESTRGQRTPATWRGPQYPHPLGRGGLTDIEWTVQLLTMMHAHEFEDLHDPRRCGFWTPSKSMSLSLRTRHRYCAKHGSWPPMPATPLCWCVANAWISYPLQARSWPRWRALPDGRRRKPGVLGRLSQDNAPRPQGSRRGLLGRSGNLRARRALRVHPDLSPNCALGPVGSAV